MVDGPCVVQRVLIFARARETQEVGRHQAVGRTELESADRTRKQSQIVPNPARGHKAATTPEASSNVETGVLTPFRRQRRCLDAHSDRSAGTPCVARLGLAETESGRGCSAAIPGRRRVDRLSGAALAAHQLDGGYCHSYDACSGRSLLPSEHVAVGENC